MEYSLIATPSLSPVGEVYICPGEVVFVCQVTYNTSDSPRRLMWRIHFKEALSEPNVTQSYILSDSVGLTQRNREIFVFTLTSNNSSGLVSTMTVDVNLGSLINDTTVSCSQGTEFHQQAVLHVHGIHIK